MWNRGVVGDGDDLQASHGQTLDGSLRGETADDTLLATRCRAKGDKKAKGKIAWASAQEISFFQ